MRRLWLMLISGVLLLSGCGFHLQGRADYPFKRLYISAPPEMQARMRRLIEGGSDTVVLTMNLAGLAQEYEQVSIFNYTLTAAKGSVLIATSTLRLNRSLTYSDQFYLAKSTEANLLSSDMRRDAADQLVRRLRVLRSPDNPLPGIIPRGPLPTPPL
jgi:LPS-assembly lipoprotein